MKKQAILLIIIIFVLIFRQSGAQSISDLVDGYFAYNRFWGNILVIQKGKVIFEKSYGYADKEKNIQNDSPTLFYLASVTKTLTAAAIFKLHEEGRLSVYDRVDKFIPGFINDNTDSLTILNLLNHTSGMAANLAHSDDFSKETTKHIDKSIVSMEQLIDSYRDTKLKSKPGLRFDYNNYGYILLAYIIEKASGTDYISYLNKSIFSEAGMTGTTDQKNLPVQPASGYFGIGTEEIIPVTYEISPSWLIGATGLYSSTYDLSRFIKAAFSCSLFSRQTLNLMLDTCINIQKGNLFWTAGWQKSEIDGHDFYSHGGSSEGFSTLAGYIPDEDISIIILSNLVKDYTKDGLSSVNFSFVDDITRNIIGIMHGRNVACLPLPKGKVSSDPVGNYSLDENHFLNVSLKHDSLLLTTDPADNFSLFDYNLYREKNDTTNNYLICKEFTSSLLLPEFGGFGKYANEKMRGTFNEEFHSSLMNFWEKVISHDGQYLSSNIYERDVKDYGVEYKLACHFERSDMIMQLSFNEEGLVSGFFILKILPKCNVKTVNLVPAGKDKYFIDGYRNGGYEDFRVKYDRKSMTLKLEGDNEVYKN